MELCIDIVGKKDMWEKVLWSLIDVCVELGEDFFEIVIEEGVFSFGCELEE